MRRPDRRQLGGRRLADCPVLLDLSASLSEDVSGETIEEAPDRSIVVSGSATECPENLIPAGPPGPVADYTVEWTGEGLLSFGPPESDGGSPVRWYEYSIDGGPWRVASTTPDGNGGYTIPLTGLVEGQTYETSVRAVNQLGAGEVGWAVLFVLLGSIFVFAARRARRS